MAGSTAEAPIWEIDSTLSQSVAREETTPDSPEELILFLQAEQPDLGLTEAQDEESGARGIEAPFVGTLFDSAVQVDLHENPAPSRQYYWTSQQRRPRLARSRR